MEITENESLLKQILVKLGIDRVEDKEKKQILSEIYEGLLSIKEDLDKFATFSPDKAFTALDIEDLDNTLKKLKSIKQTVLGGNFKYIPDKFFTLVVEIEKRVDQLINMKEKHGN